MKLLSRSRLSNETGEVLECETKALSAANEEADFALIGVSFFFLGDDVALAHEF